MWYTWTNYTSIEKKACFRKRKNTYAPSPLLAYTYTLNIVAVNFNGT